MIYNDLPSAVGNTPLIRLRKASELTGCEILGKAEFLNPGQSVKDRAAKWIIQDAVARGTLRPGGTIVETCDPCRYRRCAAHRGDGHDAVCHIGAQSVGPRGQLLPLVAGSIL